MTHSIKKIVKNEKLLRVMIQIQEWERIQLKELQTISGRNLYFRIADSYLNDSQMSQQLKLLYNGMTDRTIRIRMKEFEEIGLLDIFDSQIDQRSKIVVPTEKFLQHLNDHLDLLKKMFDQEFLMVEK